jgi:hypothetical protein
LRKTDRSWQDFAVASLRVRISVIRRDEHAEPRGEA